MRKTLRAFFLAALFTLFAVPSFAQSPAKGGRFDTQIQQDAEKLLQAKPKFQNIKAETDDAIVTLTGGPVKLYLDKLDAEKRIKRIAHVDGVRNHVEVEGNVPDAELTEKLSDKLRYDRVGYGIMFNNLTLAVKDGVATIGGQVRDYPDRDSALAIAETQSGVKDVIDNIEVLPTSNFDDDLRVKIARAIYGYASLQRYGTDPQKPIRIIVKNGHVILDGVVDSAMDRQLAGTRANGVSGVFSVDNRLMVPPSTPKKKK